MNQERPKYFSLLTETDQKSYLSLQEKLLEATKKRHRGQRLTILKDCLEKIIRYSQRGDNLDHIRCCVCGLCQLNCGIAINSRQLKYLINKCKSSINGALRLMGYKTSVSRGDINSELVNFLILFKENTSELRQWSIRTAATTEEKPVQQNITQPVFINDFKISDFDIEHQFDNESDIPYSSMIDMNADNDEISLSLTDFSNQIFDLPL